MKLIPLLEEENFGIDKAKALLAEVAEFIKPYVEIGNKIPNAECTYKLVDNDTDLYGILLLNLTISPGDMSKEEWDEKRGKYMDSREVFIPDVAMAARKKFKGRGLKVSSGRNEAVVFEPRYTKRRVY